MTIATWSNFSKRRNSTKQPSIAGTSRTVTLKEGTSLENPVFLLGFCDDSINYVQAFGAYYYVTNIIYAANNLMEVHCEKDVLATYKSEIGSYTGLVAYATQGSNLIIDRRIPMKASYTMTTPTDVLFPWALSAQGEYVLTVLTNMGMRSYAVNRPKLIAILADLQQWTDDIFNNIPAPGTTTWEIINYSAQVTMAIGKQLISFKDATQCIRNCIWLPFVHSGTEDEYIYLGEFDTNTKGERVYFEPDTQTVTVAIPWKYSDWRNCSPYTQVYLYIPFVGLLSYDPSNFPGAASFTLTFSVNRASGDGCVEVAVGNEILGTYGMEISAHYPVGAVTVDSVKQVSSIAAGVGAIAGGIAAGNPAIAVGGIGSLIAGSQNFVGNPTTIGGLSGGSGYGLDTHIKCFVVCHDTTMAPGDSAAINGKPLMDTVMLGSLSGYIQCDNASVEISGESVDKDAVNSFLNGGFFYE